MSSVDERTVKMEFDNASFKRKAAETKQSLADVNKAVDTAGKGKGLLNLGGAMQKVSVTASKMAIVTTTALATIANKVTNAGLAMVNSLTMAPIREGFAEYESLLTKQNVIMNATGKSAGVVKGVLRELNEYSDQTIYSFGNMTDAITKFVNAGVPLDRAVISIKGIANAAAFAGASSEEANRAMYAFSQSMSLGFIGLQDWMQIENANMGTVRFKTELLEAAVAAGTLTKRGKEYVTQSGKVVSATKGWRDGLQEQWATTEVLNSALGKYADENTKLGKKAFKAAQDVRTFTAFMDTLKESIGSGWSQIFQALFGNLNESTRMWTSLSNSVGEVVTKFFSFGETSLKTWRKMGGFEKTLEGFQNLLSPIGALFTTVGRAWRAAFPNSGRGAGQALYGISAGFEAITSPLRLFANLITGATPAIKFFFQVLRIGGAAVGSAIGYVGDLLTGLLGLAKIKAPSSGGLVKFAKDLAKAIAEAVDQISDLLAKGQSLTQAFGSVDIKLPSLPSLPSMPKMGNLFGDDGGASASKDQKTVVKLASGVKNLKREVLGVGKASSAVDKTTLFAKGKTAAESGMQSLGSAASDMAEDFTEAGDESSSIFVKMGGLFERLGSMFKGFVEDFSFTTLVKSFNMALLATFTISIARLFNTFSKGFSGFAQLGDTFNETLQNVGDSTVRFAKAQQRQATAKLILNLAIAIGILAVSLWVLSKIPVDDLAKALGAMGLSFVMLNQAMKSLTKLFDTMNSSGLLASVNMLAVSVAIVALAGAMVLLALACLIFNKVDFTSIIKAIAVMVVAMKVLEQLGDMGEDSWKNMLAASVALMAISGAMLVLGAALLLFNLVKWESMGKAGAALAGITAVLAGLGALAKGPYGAGALAAAGAAMVGASVGMIALAGALILFDKVKWESMGKAGAALAGLALGLIMITAGAAGGVALPAAAFGMIMFAKALQMFASVNWSSIPKMVVAMVAFAAGLAVLTPILYLAAPALLIFGVAIAAMGGGVLAFATAMSIAVGLAGVAAVALSALAIAAVTAIAIFLQTLAAQAPVMKESFLSIIQTLMDTMVESVPIIIGGIKRIWKAIEKEFTSGDKKAGSKEAGKGWVKSLADGIEERMPAIVKEASEILIAFLNGLAKKGDDISMAGNRVVASVLNGMAKNIDKVITAGANLIIAWIKGISREFPRIAKAATEAVIKLVNEMAVEVRKRTPELVAAFARLGTAVVQGLIDGIGSLAQKAWDKIGDLASGIKKKAEDVLEVFSPSRVFKRIGKFLVQGLTLGIQNNAAAAIRAVASMVSGQIAVANEYVDSFIQRLDQRAIAAMAKAQGLARAADKAAKAANKTKTKSDDRAANRLDRRADRAEREAQKAERQAEAARARQDRAEEYAKASTIDKARMRSEDAEKAMDRAKANEQAAAARLVEADALDAQARKAGDAKQRKALRREADRLRREAKDLARAANAALKDARGHAASALALQKKAGEEAAKLFQEQFELEAKTAAEEEAFSKLTNKEKAAKRRAEAEALQAKAEADLAEAKKLAFTDIEAANELAEKAMQEAEQAREYLKEAAGYESTPGGASGSVVDLEPTEAAAIAFEEYTKLVDAAKVATSATRTVEFNQYNTSPEALSPTEIYRNTNNQITFALDKLEEVGA